MKTWERYEDAARELIHRFKGHLDLQSVEDTKKKYQGKVEGWEIEVAGYSEGDGKLVVFECRHRGRNVGKSEMAAFAYTVQDLGAKKGYIVSQKGLSKGARSIATFHDIRHIPFSWEESTGDYLMRILDTAFVQKSDKAGVRDVVKLKVVPPQNT
jgi:Restriction endonuclease